MIPVRPLGPGNIRIHGKSQGYLGLPVRHTNLSDGSPVMLMAFEPTPDELKKLVNGGKVYLSIRGFLPPPMLVTALDANETPEDQTR